MLEEAGYEGGGIDPYISAISKCAEIFRDEYPEVFSPFFLEDINKIQTNLIMNYFLGRMGIKTIYHLSYGR